ncbi:unnamed protein product [Symbiodinium sp. CCMP2456]|nr:unnamed protein product [Symbiodinium sp. CCMP2456]
MHASGGPSPRDWGSVLHGGSVVVSSTGINSVINTRHAAGGSMVSSSSCSSYPTGALQTPELLDSTRDLIVFSDAITRHFHVVMSCLAQNDQDLRTGADMIHVLVVGLVGAAQARRGFNLRLPSPKGPKDPIILVELYCHFIAFITFRISLFLILGGVLKVVIFAR